MFKFNVGKIGVLNKPHKRPKLDVFLRSEVRIATKDSLKTPSTSSPCGRSGAFSYEKHTELIQAIQKTYDISYFFRPHDDGYLSKPWLENSSVD